MSSSQVGATFDAGRCALFAFDQVWRREAQSCRVNVAVLISADAKLCQLVDLGRLLDIANCEQRDEKVAERFACNPQVGRYRYRTRDDLSEDPRSTYEADAP